MICFVNPPFRDHTMSIDFNKIIQTEFSKIFYSVVVVIAELMPDL